MAPLAHLERGAGAERDLGVVLGEEADLVVLQGDGVGDHQVGAERVHVGEVGDRPHPVLLLGDKRLLDGRGVVVGGADTEFLGQGPRPGVEFWAARLLALDVDPAPGPTAGRVVERQHAALELDQGRFGGREEMVLDHLGRPVVGDLVGLAVGGVAPGDAPDADFVDRFDDARRVVLGPHVEETRGAALDHLDAADQRREIFVVGTDRRIERLAPVEHPGPGVHAIGEQRTAQLLGEMEVGVDQAGHGELAAPVDDGVEGCPLVARRDLGAAADVVDGAVGDDQGGVREHPVLAVDGDHVIQVFDEQAGHAPPSVTRVMAMLP